MVEIICPACMNRCRLAHAFADGDVIRCPSCRQGFAYPGMQLGTPAAVAAPPPLPATGGTKPCPFCGEDIKAEAKKCRYCNEVLDPVLRASQEGARAARRPAYSTGTAAVLSLVIPGAGQMYRGDTGAGVAWLLGTVFGYMLFIIPGLVAHVLCIIDAGSTKEEET